LVNFCVFHAELAKSPGWRPGFKVTTQYSNVPTPYLFEHCHAICHISDIAGLSLSYSFLSLLKLPVLHCMVELARHNSLHRCHVPYQLDHGPDYIRLDSYFLLVRPVS
jgi:hypothetical protein